ncbi:MAG TPA: DUF1634 domain-containing protein [Limnochordia bacterium]|nr:DUF1634 domain-containing protein [Limnochordia bacterium]
MKEPEGGAQPASSLDRRLASVVCVEMYLAGLVMALGLLLTLLGGASGGEGPGPDGLFPRLLLGDGAAIASLGILLLLAIPVTFVVYAFAYFARRREYAFAAASAVVLLLLLAGAFTRLD